ncbi:PREDICTED: cytochrome P450 9e2-like [Nicrophorus vespilloides]|uniref:Cytochrome P450 9e2-like n=1 Tax=Nicrophorus vespilloides TaxID=110193 RepID=A0ABM1MRZ6_NICVS|nr:PREDICTED: cytochrome P450 9e2-like [Nicrophorus vespilloides]
MLCNSKKMLSYLLSIVVFAFLFYWKFVKPLNYWNERGVPNVKGFPVFGKQAAIVFRKINIIEWMKRTYKECPGTRYHGSHQFNRPVLVIKDPSLIKQIMVKDFGNFVNRIDVITKDMDPLLGNSLVFLHNQEWKTMRSTLSAAFTGSKMKEMTDLMLQLSHNFFKYLSKNGKSRFAVDMKDLSTRYTNDIIASCAYGIECNSLKDKSNDIYKLGKQISFDNVRVLKIFGFNIMPKLMKMMNINVLPKSAYAKFSSIIKESLAARESGNIIRPDMIQLLMMAKKGNLKYEESIKDDDTGFATVQEHYTEGRKMLTDNDIVAQALVFFLAGFEPVSTIISFMALELALNPDIQEKLYEEIERFGDIDYNKIISMRYLDMVVSETLRKWPSAPVLHRTCTVPFVLKAERPDESDLCIGVGDGVIIPIIGIQNDEKYFPNPERFDPERFSDENKDKVDKYTYLTFGTGPRNCIGSRFALLEIKMFFAVALKYFRIEAIEKTPSTLKLSPKEFPMKPIGGFWVGFSIRNS